MGLLVETVLAAEPMAQGWKAYCSHQIVGMPVKNPQREELGKISDLVTDSQGHVPFVVLSYGGMLGIGRKSAAIPFGALTSEEKNLDSQRTHGEIRVCAQI